MLKFIGIGSAFNTALGNNSAYINKEETLIIIDCGSGVFSRIQKFNILQGVKNIYVLITHCHPDHIGSLGDLVFYSYYMLNTKIHINFPDGVIVDILNDMGVNRELYYYDKEMTREIAMESKENFNKIKIEFIPTAHDKSLNCFGLLFTLGNKSFYYSGDSNNIKREIMSMLKDGRLERLYQDTSKADYEGNGHCSLRKLEGLIEPELRNKIYCMHLDTEFDSKEAQSLGFNVVKCEFN